VANRSTSGEYIYQQLSAFWTLSYLNLAETALYSGKCKEAASLHAESSRLATHGFSAFDMFGLSLVEFSICIEALQLDRARIIQLEIKRLALQIGGATFLNVADATGFALASEIGGNDVSACFSGAIQSRLEFDTDVADTFVRHWCYCLKEAGRLAQWQVALQALSNLDELLARSGNPRWYSWLWESSAHTLASKGEFAVASSVIAFSKDVIEQTGIVPTPRQLQSWARIEKIITPFNDQSTHHASKLWSGPNKASLQLLQQCMRQALLDDKKAITPALKVQ
jgi:hypothetical protein